MVTQHSAEVVVSDDEMDLQQVVLNFVVNARDAMPRGGRLRVATGARDVKLEENSAGGRLVPGRWAYLSVEDTGHGIEP